MSPRPNDSNASSTKQKKKQNQHPAPLPSVSLLDSPNSPDALLAPLDSTTAFIDPTSATTPGAAHQHGRVGPDSPALDLAASSSPTPRLFVASSFKPVSAIDSVTSTISAISHHANRGISSLIAAHSASTNPASPAFAADTTPLRTDGSVSPIYDAFHNAGSTPDPAHIEAALHNAGTSHPAAPRVLWSRWDRLPLKSHPLKFAPLLISYYDDGSLQALLLQDRTMSELLSLPNAADVLLDRTLPASSLARAQLLTALVRPPSAGTSDPQLLLVLQEPGNATRLLAYSLTFHQVWASVQLQHHATPTPPEAQHHDQRRNLLWPQVQAQCNHDYLVLSFAAPASIHVLSASTLEYLRSPILDVAAASAERPPPFSLSHRLLAFACTASKDVSPIRSDMRKVSNPAYHDPSRSFATVQSDASARVGEMRDNLFETSAHVGDAARRIRGGVMSGVRTLGEWGGSYWPQAGSPPVGATAFSPPQSSLLSQSAPHTASNPLRPASSASNSPMLLAADGGRAAKRLSTGASAGADVAAGSSHGSHTVQAGCVRVIDLASDARTVCTFAPSNHAVTLVSFSPCGHLILTADSLGHAFHVFELPLTGTFGNAATASSAATVLHRYKLMRGITTADVVHAQWSPDAQWVAVGTHSGTVHIYAVNPFGGVPCIANHVQAKVRNPHVLQPFGLSLSSLARSVRPPAPPLQDVSLRPTTGPLTETHFAPSTDVQIKVGPPAFLLVNHASPVSRSDADVGSPFELLTSDPRSVSVTLHTLRCWSTQTRVASTSVGSEEVHATGTDSKHRFVVATSPRSSGLSQMMRKAGEGLLTTQQAPRLQAECVRAALWHQLSPDAGSVTKHSVAALGDQMSASELGEHDSAAQAQRSVAKAEIETYSQSSAMLPSSIFLSRQTFFHARTLSSSKSVSTPSGEAESLRLIQRRGSRPIQVRRTARLVSREPSSEDPSSFDDSLAGALDQMSFNPEHLPPRSASAHIPSFPQGQRGRSAGWTAGSSIPIRIVAGGLGGIYRAGKELGRGVEKARRRTSGTSGTTAPDDRAEHGIRDTASISFDGLDDVDLLGEDDDLDRASRHRYRSRHGAASQAEHAGSTRSDLSLLSELRSDEPSKGSQPSSAETPSTRFSEAEDGSADTDECDWDAIEARRSPTAPVAPPFDGQNRKKVGLQVVSETHGRNSMEDDFTVGMLEEDAEEAALMHSQSSVSPAKDSVKARVNVPKELVYALPSGGSTRSSLLSQSSGKTAAPEARAEAKALQARDSSPSNSEGGDSGSQKSAGSGMLCEGGKETHTIDSSPSAAILELDAPTKQGEPKADKAVAAKPISTSGGGKKKKKGGR